MKICSLFLMLFSLCAASAAAPNILLIYSDDHGWADLAMQGVDPDIRTPNLDQLVRDGVRFTRGYVSAPQCVPSRAGVITGTHQNRFGVEDNNKGPLPLDVLTLPERLKRAGYVTGMSGKWHLDLGAKTGQPRTMRVLPDHMPQAHGFDEYWRGEMRQYYASHALDGTPFADAPHLVSDDRFRVTVQTEAALSFLKRRAPHTEIPWFLYLAWFAPHVPLESPEPWFSKTPENLPKERRQALAMIACMDDGLGRIRAQLKAMQVEKNTLVFFISDNGAPLKKGAWDGSVNAPLIGEKGMLTDGGVRVPFVAAWPGKIPAGMIYEKPVLNLDVAATAVALAELPHDDQLDGVNLMPFLLGAQAGPPHEALFWRWRSQSAVLEFPWKLIHLGETQRFLFDVTEPSGEKRNLLADHPEIAERLEQRFLRWSATLKPPGPAGKLNDQDLHFFADHVDPSLATLKAKDTPEIPGSIQGWLCRNGSISVKSQALTITPDSKGRVFITKPDLAIPGPVLMTLSLRSQKGGAASVSWRVNGDKDFVPPKTVSFDWPSSTEWQQVQVPIPAQGKMIHLRITPAKSSVGLELQSVQLHGKGAAEISWHF